MKTRLLIIGIILIVIGGYLSTIHYNPAPAFGTVHEFSYGCLAQSPEFLETFDSAHERGMCTHNYVLSIILIVMIVCGTVLAIKSKFYQ